jgi:hypothetical protein
MSNDPTIVTAKILHAIEDLKNGTGFGSIEIIVHDGRVTQIEKREKQRFGSSKSAADKENRSTTLNTNNSEATK